MPLSANIFNIDSGSAGQIIYDLAFEGPTPGYLEQAHVFLHINSIPTDVGGGSGPDGFTWITSTRVQLKNYVPVAGDKIEFRRTMPTNDIYINFENGAGIEEDMLDKQALAALYAVHEILDGYGTGISDSTALAQLYANAPEDYEVEPGKYSSYHFSLKAAAEVVLAAAEKTAAIAAKVAAEAAQVAAEAAQAAAEAAKTAAETAQTGAETAETNAVAVVAAGLDEVFNTTNEYTATQNFNETSLSSSIGNVSWDLAANQVCKLVLSEDSTFLAPSNHVAGAQYRLTIIQSAPARTVSWNANFKWENDLAPEIPLTDGARVIIFLDDDGVNLWGKAFYSEE